MSIDRGTPRKLFIIIMLLASSTVVASADAISFTGTFTEDNAVQFFTFSLLTTQTVTLQTLGYGGGTNAAGHVIPAGGFESVLQVYDAAGNAIGGPILPGPDPTCGPRTPDPNRGGFCQDAYAQELLSSGSYLLALTQNANLPNGNLSDGFYYVDTDPEPFFNNGFVGTFGYQGNGNWAVDILNVDSAQAVPEPGPLALTGTTLLLVGLGTRRRRGRNTNDSN